MAALTLDDLKATRPCNADLALFEALYAEGGEVTVEQALRGALKFDWLKASHVLLTPKQQQHFKMLMLIAFRGLNRVKDPDKSKRRRAMAGAFCAAYNSPKE